jgi:hypothetical protein
MFLLKSKQWRAIALSLLLVLAMVVVPLPVDQHSGVAAANNSTIENPDIRWGFDGESTDSVNGIPINLNNEEYLRSEISGEKINIGKGITDGIQDVDNFGSSRTFAFSFKTNESGTLIDTRSSRYDYGLQISVNNDELFLRSCTSDQCTNQWIGGVYNDNEFHNVAVVFNSPEGNTRTYIDGELAGTRDHYGYSSSSELRIGSSVTSSSSFNDLDFDELRLYDAALNEDEAKQLTTDPTAGYIKRVTGQVVDQDGNPVSRAYIEGYGVSGEDLPPDTTIDDILDDITEAEPPNFNQDLDFNSFTTGIDASFPLMHTREDWGLTGWTDNVDVSEPQVVYEAGEPFVLSAWDPSAGGVGDGLNSIYNTWPGRAEPGKTVTIQEIDYAGQAVGDPRTFDTTADDTYFAPAPTQPGKVEVDGMPAGFYRLSVEGSDAGYPIAITPDGNPESLLRMIQKDLRDGSGEFSDYAKNIKEKLEDGSLGRYTTQANHRGEFTIEVENEVDRIALQATKGHLDVDLESDTDPLTQILEQIDSRSELQRSIYVSPTPQRFDVPSEGVELETISISTDVLGDCESLDLPDEICEIEEELPAPPDIPDIPINPPEDPLKELEELILNLVDRLESAANSDQLDYYLENSQFSELPTEDDIRDLSRHELRDEISAAYAALSYDPDPPITVPDPPDPIEPIELIEHLMELLSLVKEQGVQTAYLDNSQFDEIPDRTTVEDLDRTELIDEIDAANKALLDNVITPPEPPEPPSLDPFRDHLESLLRTVAGSDTMTDAYLEESRYDTIPDRQEIDAMEEQVLMQEIEAATAAIQTLPPIPEPPEPPEPPELPEPPDLSQLQDYLIELVDVIEAANITEAYLDNSQFERLPDDSDIEALDQVALYEEINAATDVIESPPESPEVPDPPEMPEPPEPPGDGLSMTIPIPNNIDQSNIAVEIEWGDGSVDVMNKRYFTVDQPLIGQDVVKIENYPLSIKANGRSLADIIVRTSNEDGRHEQRIPIRNPAFNGDIPAIQAVDISTTRPGPDQWVSVQLRPRADAGYQSLHSVDVYDPDGNLLEVRRNGEKARFLTEGAGIYRIRLLYDSRTNDRFSKTIAIQAGETSLSTPPTIRMERSVAGPFGLAGDGFANVLIDNTDGNNLELAGILPGDARTPSEVHLKPNAVQSSSETEISLAVLRGDSQTQVREHMGVVVHEAKWTTDSIVYRNGNEPITVEGETRYGEIAQPDQNDESRRLIQTYTDADGVIDVSVNREPDLFDNIRHWIRVNSPIDTDGILTTTLVDPIATTATTGLTPSTGGSLEATT